MGGEAVPVVVSAVWLAMMGIGGVFTLVALVRAIVKGSRAAILTGVAAGLWIVAAVAVMGAR